jgi:hypothetical protein
MAMSIRTLPTKAFWYGAQPCGGRLVDEARS